MPIRVFYRERIGPPPPTIGRSTAPSALAICVKLIRLRGDRTSKTVQRLALG